MTITCNHPGKGPNRANKVYVNTKYSQDGRQLEGFWLDYSPEEPFALFLLTKTLDKSSFVDYYDVYDAAGNRLPVNRADAS